MQTRRPMGRFTNWWQQRSRPEEPSPVPAMPASEGPRAAARFVVIQYALHDDGTLRELLETITRQDHAERSHLARMLGQASRAVTQHAQATPPIHFTSTGDHLDVNMRIVNLHGLLLAMQNDPQELGDVLTVTLAATLIERRSPPTDLPGLLSNLPADALLRAQICWSPAHGPLSTAGHAQEELAALADHLQE